MIKIFLNFNMVLLLLCSCSTKIISNNTIIKIIQSDMVNDSLFYKVFNKGIKTKGLYIIQPKPEVEFISGEFDTISFYKYQFNYKNFKYQFLLELYPVAKRSLFLNNSKAKLIKYNQNFNIDSMNLNIDYTESEFYLFKNDAEYLLVVSKPMNWVGKMTKYSFFQLINIQENTAIEFIKKEE